MENYAVWGNVKSEYPKFKGKEKREAVVIGGGIAGVLTAFKLSEAGKKVTLLEADALFSGTTGKTTAKITYNQGYVYSELYARYGSETAKLYFQSQKEGIKGFLSLIEKYSIDCDLQETASYIFTFGSDERLKNNFKIMRNLGAEVNMQSGKTDVFPVTNAIIAEKQYLFNPIKFLKALPKKFEIYENTRVINVDTANKIINCENGIIEAQIIVIATHFPIIDLYGGYPFKLRQSLSYTIATDKHITENAYLEDTDDGISFRPYTDGTIIGGCDHRTGRSAGQESFKKLKKQAAELFGVKDITHFWAAEDVMTFDKMPMAGIYSKKTDGIFVITGFNKWGMTNAMVCSDVVRDCILKKDNRYSSVFSPQRHIKYSANDFISNALINFKEIFLGYFRIVFNRKIPKGCGKIVRFHGKKRAVYRDENGAVYILGTKCPHLHGELKWNAETKTWDCPCHGSRFDIYGNPVSEPTTKSCKYIKYESKCKN